jgi:hypothetical protein
MIMSQSSQENKPAMSKRQLSAEEQRSIMKMKQRGMPNLQPIFRPSESNENNTLDLAYDKNLETQYAKDLINASIAETTGSTNLDVGIHLLTTAGQAVLSGKSNVKEMATRLEKLAQSMRSFAPQDEYEGQLAAQLVVLHDLAMSWLGRANFTERINFANVYLNGASKLLTRHHETLEALLKYRRKGVQKVHVEHVHVNNGGQAIVGNIMTGGGMNQKLEEGPYAKV